MSEIKTKEHKKAQAAIRVALKERKDAEVETATSEHSLPSIDETRLRSIIESVVFVSDKVITLDQIHSVVGNDLPKERIRQILADLIEEYSSSNRGFHLMEVSGGYQFRSNPENADWIAKLLDAKPTKLSRAALEVLAIVAYRQPTTRLEIESLRGVDSSGVIRVLLDRKLIKVVGRKHEPGKPRLYATTSQFLEVFGLRSLEDLPPLREFEELTEESQKRLDKLLSSGMKVRQQQQGAHAEEESYAAASVHVDDNHRDEKNGESNG